jgi:hypothetical protein
MPLSYKDTSKPAAEPVLIALAHSQLNLDTGFVQDDTYITGLIVAAREHVENLTNRAIYNRTMELWLDFFPFPDYSGTINLNDRHCPYGSFWHKIAIRLPKPSAVSVQSVTYTDLNGTTQTIDPSLYYLDPNSEPARIVPKPGIYWPYSQSYLPGSVCVSYTAGTYGDGVTVDNCPMTIKQAMLLLVSHWYTNREAASAAPPKEIDIGVKALLDAEMFETFGF